MSLPQQNPVQQLADLQEAPSHQAVIQDYLDFMLRAATTEPVLASVEDPVTAELPPAQLSIPPPVQLAAENIQAPDPVEPDVLVCEAAVSSVSPFSPREANGRPNWAQSLFSCLLFRVDGLRLVAPLTELGGIAELGQLTPIFAQPDWFMGLLRHNGVNVRVVDTARLIMPERIKQDDLEQHRKNYRCVLLLDGTDWGLAMDGDAESLNLGPAEVRWRVNLEARPWLAGTVTQRLCAVLDVRALAYRLDQSSKSPAWHG